MYIDGDLDDRLCSNTVEYEKEFKLLRGSVRFINTYDEQFSKTIYPLHSSNPDSS